MEKEHHYSISMARTGNRGEGTRTYTGYDRDHVLQVKGKPEIAGSSDPSFRGSPARYNPEELLVSALSSCHMLWFLHLCSVHHIIVTDYRDEARGIMMERADGSGYFKEVELHPVVTLAEAGMIALAGTLHEKANQYCFVANSVNFPVKHVAVFLAAGTV